jgi:hypothetical protein
MHTFSSALSLVGVTVPDHLAADADVPILTGAQAQGDLIVIPVPEPTGLDWETLPSNGIQVVHGEAGGNTHWLHPGFDSPGVCWAPTPPPPRPTAQAGLALGHVRVPEGQSALLIHTDEHGANGLGPGTYVLHRKRQLRLNTAAQRPEVRRTAGNPRPRPQPNAWDLVWD